MDEFVETADRLHFNHVPDYCSVDVFTGRHISSYNMVQFECFKKHLCTV